MFEFIDNILKQALGSQTQLIRHIGTSGGCINHSIKVETNQGNYFLKWNPNIPDDMFAREARGLELLRLANELTIPNVVAQGKLDGKNYLILEHIDSMPQSSNYWIDFGESLAALHKNHQRDKYGLDHANYIGALPQHNDFCDHWIDFFREKRLEYQLNLALQNGLVDDRFAVRYRSFYDKLADLLPVDPPSLLHGDLWSGNVMTGHDGMVCLIDPAVYYGHREVELSFTRMFGGFSREFYQSYHAAYPLDPGFDERVDIYNIYPSMVHVNLFGISYLSGVEHVLKKYL